MKYMRPFPEMLGLGVQNCQFSVLDWVYSELVNLLKHLQSKEKKIYPKESDSKFQVWVSGNILWKVKADILLWAGKKKDLISEISTIWQVEAGFLKDE